MPETVEQQPQATGTDTQTPVTTGQPTQQPSNTGQPAQAATPANRSDDDRRNEGLLADLKRERQARQQYQQQVQAAQQELEQERRRVQALAGVNLRAPDEVEADEIRAQFAKVFPHLGKLTADQIENLLLTAESSTSLRQSLQLQWENHAGRMIDSLSEQVAEAIGGDLTDRQRRALARAYVVEAENNPEFLRRHEKGDPKLVEEFASQWIEDWFKPAQRRATAVELGRQRQVPNGRDRNVQTTPPKAIDYKNPKAVEDAMVESFKRNGGVFGE